MGSRFDDLEFPDLCWVLLRNCEVPKSEPNRCYLFEKHLLPRQFIAEISYVRGLRNKYAHLNALPPPEKEQLGDIIVVERVVRALQLGTATGDAGRDIRSAIDSNIDHLVARVASARMPDEFDTNDAEANADVSVVLERLGELRAILLAQGTAAGSGTPEAAHAPAAQALLERLDTVISEVTKQGAGYTRLQQDIAALKRQFDAVLNQLEGIRSSLDKGATESAEMTDGSEDEEPEDAFDVQESLAETLRLLASIKPLSRDEARAALIELRQRIWDNLGIGASVDGLLRRRLMDQLLEVDPIIRTTMRPK
jgi:hypothetical protein